MISFLPADPSTFSRTAERPEGLELDENKLPPKLRKTLIQSRATALRKQNETQRVWDRGGGASEWADREYEDEGWKGGWPDRPWWEKDRDRDREREKEKSEERMIVDGASLALTFEFLLSFSV